MEKLIIILFGTAIVDAIVFLTTIFLKNNKKKNEKKIEIIPYIEPDDEELISKEIDDFIRENNCYIPKR